MTKLLSLMVSNGLVALPGALVCQSQKYGDVGSGTGAIVIGLAAIVIGEVLMGRLTSFLLETDLRGCRFGHLLCDPCGCTPHGYGLQTT